MAPVSDRIYFPSLEECLSGEKVVLTWKLIASALVDESGERQKSPAVIDFFDDDYVRGLLKSPTSVFAPSSDATQKDFETKTAPINVTSASSDRVDVKTIKEDAQWLSKNAKINLVAALRLVVIEYQSRPLRQLTGPLSSQDATNLQEAAGLSDGRGTSFLGELGAAGAQDADEICADFEKTESKKHRLFDTYLSERRAFMMAADYTHSIKLYGQLPVFTSAGRSLAQLYRLKVSAQLKEEIDGLLPPYLQALTDAMGRVEQGVKSTSDDTILLNDEVELDWLRTMLTEAVHAMSVIFQLADKLGDEFASWNCVSQWFGMMEKYNFFDQLQPIHDSIAGLIMPLKSLSAAISIALLKPARALSYLSERDEDTPGADDAYDSYLLSSDVLEQVHKSIIGAASSDSEIASPVILSWTLILHRMNVSYQGRTEKRDNLLLQNARENFEAGPVARPPTVRRNSAGSIFSIESSRFDGFLENSTTPKDLQVVEQLATGVTAHGRVYDVMSRMASNVGSIIDGSMPPLTSSRIRATFLEVLKVSYPIIGYQSDPMSCLLSLLSTGKDYWDIATERHLAPEDDVVAAMVEDDYLLEFYFQQALDRYPYEFLPFISLCRALCTDTNVDGDEKPDLILNLLRRTPTLTFVLPPSFQQYELVQEDENTNSFSLLEEIPLISLSASWRRRIIEDEAFRLPVGTYGRFLTDTGRVVQVEYPHSSLALLGRRLEINLMPEGYQTELGMMEPQEVAEVISLFATLIRIDKSRSTAADSTSIVLQSESDIIAEASKHIAGGKDLVTIVCDTMDSFLQEERAMGDDSSLSVLNSCIQFLDSILPFFPNRVWSHLARSDLLDSDSRAGKLVRITSTLDLVSSRFDFLNSSANFFSNLIDSAMTSAVQRQLGNKSLGRQRPESNPWSGTANKVLARVSYYIAQASVDIFENTSTWRFESEEQRVLLIGNVVPILDKIIRYSYSMGDIESSECLTSTLRPAAEYVVDCFLEPATGTLRFKPILTSLIIAFTSPHDTLYPNRFYALSKQTKSILRFSTTVLRVSNLLDRSSGMIENYLFKSCTLLVRLCAVSDHFRTPALWLIKALVVNAGKSTNEPPSLLGYLGPQTSKSFLQLLSMLCKPFVLSSEVKTTWRFFSAILRNRQQWMSNCLLTGQTPREAMKKDLKKTESSPDSIFATALNKLSGLKDLDPEQALYILDFVASAQNYWPWTVFTLQKDTSYMDGLRAYVRDLKPSQLTVKSSVSRAAVEARVAAYVAETFAMQLYHSRHLGDVDALAKKLAADLDYYLRDGVEVAGYNKSLHINFAKNFANKYSGCSLDNFKRTLLEPRELGTSYYYDLDRADTMLRFDPGWLGRKDNGFKTEMGLANANLSLVDAQIALFHAWEFLLLELSTCLPKNDTIAKQMLQVAQQCLNANQTVLGPESIFVKVETSRAALALLLIQRLATSNLPVSDVNQLLSTAVGAVNGVEEPFSSESISYYRTLLKALFVTLRAYQQGGNRGAVDSQVGYAGSSVTVIQIVLNILDKVVGHGFRTLATLIHDDEASILPEDLALLTAILQACLSLPGIEQSQTQVLNIIASHDCVPAATSLFSWADKLADQGDPVYGELSILFLLELSTFPVLAEQMACDGVLSNLLSANLTKYMLKTHISPHADVAVSQRCYGIWVKGFLPLMLNLLAALGATVAPEIAYVLNQFSHLLDLSVDRLDGPGMSRTKSASSPHYLTLLAASEVHSLALLTRVIAALRINNSRDIPEVSWNSSAALENVEFWLSTKKLLKERLLPLGPREVEWRATARSSKGSARADNVLEEKVIAQLEAIRDVLGEELEAD